MRLKLNKQVLAAVLGIFITCSGAQARELVDLAGRNVKVPDQPKRVLLGEGRFVFAMAALDKDNPVARVVGWQGELKRQDPFAWAQLVTYFPDAAKVPLIGTTSEASVSPEKILSLQPDLAVFSLSGHGPGRANPMIRQLQEAGIPIVFIDFRQNPLRNTVASMRILGQALGKEKEAQEYIDFYTQHLSAVEKMVSGIPANKRPRVFVEMLAGAWPACCHTAGDGNFGDMVEAAGGVNIAKNIVPSSIGDVSMEFVLKEQPDVYVATGSRSEPGRAGLLIGPGATPEMTSQSMAVLMKRQGFSSLNALKQGRAYGIWHAYYNSPYNILAVERLASWFYPEQAKAAGIVPEDTLAQLYQRFIRMGAKGQYWTGPVAQ